MCSSAPDILNLGDASQISEVFDEQRAFLKDLHLAACNWQVSLNRRLLQWILSVRIGILDCNGFPGSFPSLLSILLNFIIIVS